MTANVRSAVTLVLLAAAGGCSQSALPAVVQSGSAGSGGSGGSGGGVGPGSGVIAGLGGAGGSGGVVAPGLGGAGGLAGLGGAGGVASCRPGSASTRSPTFRPAASYHIDNINGGRLTIADVNGDGRP